ncbi:HAD family phosphatase [Olsenella uli]|uniref:HAD family hydrolase n=1 Tax=Olsenella uli TaxID=133926 RepID=UPI001959618F|nr:HAD family phosphatase [Olsenella uli]MBM6675366.1 HAD family phosphatase [Olsenella uli]
MPTPQAVIFDMDGTLIDTERVSQTAWRRAAADLGLDVPGRIWNAFVGCSIPNARAMINEEFGDERLTDRLFAHQRELFFALEDEILAPREGALEALRALAEAGVTLALATTTERAHAQKEMDRFGMTPFFSAMTFGDEIERSKPAPDIYLEAARRLVVAPEACAAVEDSMNGARAALAAGMVTYLVPEWAEADPDVTALCAAVLDGLAELPAAILG